MNLMWAKFHRNMHISFGGTNAFLNILILLPIEKQPASHRLQHSVSSKWLGYWTQYFVILLRSYQVNFRYNKKCICHHAFVDLVWKDSWTVLLITDL
jgi:hypothetical protein